MYEKGAHMVAFHIRRERLEYWIRAFSMFYYELYGNNSDLDINWYDDPRDWVNNDGSKAICIDVLSTKNNDRLYKITFFINTGVIQAQGNAKNRVCYKRFPSPVTNSKCSIQFQ